MATKLESAAAPAGTVCCELRQQFRLAIPATLTYLFGRSLVSISLVFIGRMGDLQLAAAALANTSTNVSGLSIMVGMGTAVSTVCGQAYGAQNYRKVGETLQLGMLVFWLACLPISLLWWNGESVLLLCGQDPAVAEYAGRYIRYLIPFIWCFAAQSAINSYLQAQRIMSPGALASILIAPIHLVVCFIMFSSLNTGFIGGALALITSGLIQTVILVAIVRFRGLHVKTWVPLCTRGVLSGMVPFVKLCLAGIISLSEWWASEIAILLSGLLPHAEYNVAAMSIFQITIGQCFYFSLGIGIAVSTRVANALGANNAAGAQLAAKTAIGYGISMVSTLSLLIYFCRNLIWQIYTDDEQLGAIMAKLFFILSFYIVGDGMCVIFGSILRGCALQVMAAKVVVFSYYVVGLPVGIILGFYTDMQVYGLAWGVTIGTWVHASLYGMLVAQIDWREQAQLAVSRSRSRGTDGADDDAALGGNEKERISLLSAPREDE